MKAVVFAATLAVGACRGPTPSPPQAPVLHRDHPASTPATADDAQTIAELRASLADPSRDPDGTSRARLAAELRTSTDPAAVALLIDVLRQPADRQPAIVHRQAITSLGAMRAASAVDAILVAMFTVPDAATTSSISERAKAAVASIGTPAVPRIVAMLEGRHEGVAAALRDNGIDPVVAAQTAAMLLSGFDDPGAASAVMRALKQRGCTHDLEAAFLVHALGRLGHAAAANEICSCHLRGDNPGIGFPAAEALAFIGGEVATACLVRAIRTAAWSPDAVASKDFVHELRWEAVRFAALAGGADAVPEIRDALARNKPAVREHAKPFEPMLAALDRCGDDERCLDELLADETADRFAREAAAFARARQDPESIELAHAVSRLFAVADPDVRVSAAVLTLRLSPPRGCPQCTQTFRDVMERERGSMPAEMQAAVLTARVAIATVGDDATHVPFPKPMAKAAGPGHGHGHGGARPLTGSRP